MLYCPKCGAPTEDDAKFCTSCGEPMNAGEPNSENNTSFPNNTPPQNNMYAPNNTPSPFISAFASTLFLAICVLITIATVLAFSVPSVLFAIFCWIIYFNAKNDKLNIAMMRAVSGTVFATKIIYFVGAIILLICAGIIFLCAMLIPSEVVNEVSAMYDEIMAAIAQEGLPQEVLDICAMIFGYGINKVLGFMAGMLAVLGAYLLALGIIWGGVHKFSKEFYTKLETGATEFANAKKGASCLMASGVIMAVVAISEIVISFQSILPSLVLAAAIIVGSVFIKKNFK